jgi:hypothetical protein
VSLAELKQYGTASVFKFTLNLTPNIVSGMASANGLVVLGIGLGASKGAFPDPSFSPTPLSAWFDPALPLINVVAVTPDPGVTVESMTVTFPPSQVYYYSGTTSTPPQPASLGRQLSMNVKTYGAATTVATAPFPNITFHLTWTLVAPT